MNYSSSISILQLTFLNPNSGIDLADVVELVVGAAGPERVGSEIGLHTAVPIRIRRVVRERDDEAVTYGRGMTNSLLLIFIQLHFYPRHVLKT